MGQSQCITQYGRMPLTKHNTILSVLEKRALRYRARGKHASLHLHVGDDIDETGTVETESLTDSDGDSINSFQGANIKQQELDSIKDVDDELLKVHGAAPGSKAEGVVRLIYENANGINSRLSNNDKLYKAKELIDDLEADLVAYNEHRLNLAHKQNRNGFSQLFRGGETEIRSVAAHNVHEGRDVGRIQEGGTCMMAYGPLIEQYDFEESQKDPTGLGRWVVMVFRGSDGITTRVVCGYNPCYNKHGFHSRTSYQQHRRYFVQKEKDSTCPRTRFRQDLLRQLTQWRNAGDRLIVCLDTNENIYTKSIGKALTSHTGLDMREVVGEFTGKQLGATFFRGSKPIDGIWATKDVRVVGARVMPCGFGIGDHRLVIIDFLKQSLVGAEPPRVIRAAARRLNTKIPVVTDNYIRVLKDLLREHKIAQRALAASKSSEHTSVVKERTDVIDIEKKQYMAHAEKKCRLIKSARIPFSPESAIWIRRRQVYQSLLKFKKGKIRNKANLKRTARRCGIQNALRLSRKEIRMRLEICEEKCSYFLKHGSRYRRKFLERRLSVARIIKNREAERRILEIIERERQRAFWRRLNYHMRKEAGWQRPNGPGAR